MLVVSLVAVVPASRFVSNVVFDSWLCAGRFRCVSVVRGIDGLDTSRVTVVILRHACLLSRAAPIIYPMRVLCNRVNQYPPVVS